MGLTPKISCKLSDLERCQHVYSNACNQIDNAPRGMSISSSFPMRVLGAVGFHKVAWRLRRLHCPVKRDALVLEIGAQSVSTTPF